MEDIREYARRLAEEFHPVRIILFGSWARGQQGAESDVDVMVILPFDGSSARKGAEMRLRVSAPFPLDLLPVTPTDFKTRVQSGYLLFLEVANEGVILHEAGVA
jgi:predicted nucleotidyltransferase